MIKKFMKIWKVLQEIATYVSIGILMIIFILNLMMVCYVKQQLSLIYAGIDITNYNLTQLEKRIEEKTIDEIKKDIELVDMVNKLAITSIKTDEYLTNFVKILKEQIERQSTEVEQIEKRLKQVTVMIQNITQGYQGSGVTIKYKDNYYILSVNHLIVENTDELYISENEQPYAKLKIIKTDETRDLTLFKLENENNIPEVYTELAENELEKGDPIYVVGNPLGIEDVLSEGRILKNEGFSTYFIDHSYFGSSGGGIFTKQGKLIGIIQTLRQIKIMEDVPSFVINGAGRLSMIKDFLGDI